MGRVGRLELGDVEAPLLASNHADEREAEAAVHILIATDGTLDEQHTSDAVARMYRPGDTVTVFTAVNFPRNFLRSFGQVSGVAEVVKIADETGPGLLGFAGGAKAAERMERSGFLDPWRSASSSPSKAGVSGSLVEEYLKATADDRVKPLQEALEAQGVTSEAACRMTENQPARTILETAREMGADTLVVGCHGRGRFEGLLGSTATKLVRHAPIDVMVLCDEQKRAG